MAVRARLYSRRETERGAGASVRNRGKRESTDPDRAADASSDGDEGGDGGSRRARTRRRRTITAAVVFVLTPLTALVVQDVYDRAKTVVDPRPFGVAVAPYDDCPYGTWLFPPGFDPASLPGYDRLDSRWAYEHGGATVDHSATGVTFQAEGDATVVLQDMRVEVLQRRPPATGVLVTKCDRTIKAALDVRRFTIDLDAAHPTPVPEEPERNQVMRDGPRFGGFPYRVSASDPEVFHLMADTENCSCTWRAEVDWTTAGGSGTTVLDLGSSPLRTAAAADGGVTGYAYAPDGSVRPLGEQRG